MALGTARQYKTQRLSIEPSSNILSARRSNNASRVPNTQGSNERSEQSLPRISQQPRQHKKPAGVQLDQVTPELAAQIIKHYVLPMFDSKKFQTKRPQTGNPSLYSKLKLTESLFNELEKIRDDYHTQQTNLDRAI